MSKFKITVIGTINRDTIIFPDGRRTESFGGILYNLSALSGLGGRSVEIYPVCNLGYDVYDKVKGILKKFDNVKLEGIEKAGRKNNHAFLLIDQENQRTEILRYRVPVLSFSQIKPFLDSDVILVNFISGFDVTLNTLKIMRKNTHSEVFLDIHSFTLGIRKDGRRFLRAPKNWREYIRQADLVQANLPELNVLSYKRLGSLKEIRDFGKYILSLGPNLLLVTLGESGALMLHRKGKAIKLNRCEGIKVSDFKDATGCGDVFSAGFLMSYLETRDLNKSLNFANQVAVEKCKISGIKGVSELLKRVWSVRL
jgi:sugar/nucleoside kinase (ribokinase family)